METMQPDRFVRAVKSILCMAAIDFTKAVFATGYMENLYDASVYKKLEFGIDRICEDLKNEIFGG